MIMIEQLHIIRLFYFYFLSSLYSSWAYAPSCICSYFASEIHDDWMVIQIHRISMLLVMILHHSVMDKISQIHYPLRSMKHKSWPCMIKITRSSSWWTNWYWSPKLSHIKLSRISCTRNPKNSDFSIQKKTVFRLRRHKHQVNTQTARFRVLESGKNLFCSKIKDSKSRVLF